MDTTTFTSTSIMRIINELAAELEHHGAAHAGHDMDDEYYSVYPDHIADVADLLELVTELATVHGLLDTSASTSTDGGEAGATTTITSDMLDALSQAMEDEVRFLEILQDDPTYGEAYWLAYDARYYPAILATTLGL